MRRTFLDIDRERRIALDVDNTKRYQELVAEKLILHPGIVEPEISAEIISLFKFVAPGNSSLQSTWAGVHRSD